MKFRNIGIVLKPEMEDPAAYKKLIDLLRSLDVSLCIDEQSKHFLPNGEDFPMFTDCSSLDLLLVIGGDGTILRAVRDLSPNCPILSIHYGTIGFLSELTFDEAPDLLPKFLNGEGVAEERKLLSVSALRGSKKIFEGDVLNEAVIAQGSIARLIDLRAEVNGEPLTTFRSDGLIMSTPTGSTAYNLAAGGPIVHPRLHAMILTPINSHSLSQKPVVLPGDADVLVEVLPKERAFIPMQVSLTLDGQQYVPLERGDTVRVKTSNRSAIFLRSREETFLQTLRAKLKWGERPTA